MKKLFATLTLAATGVASASTLTVGYDKGEGLPGRADNQTVVAAVREPLTDKFAIDFAIRSQQVQNTARSQNVRYEVGGTYSQPLGGGLRAYVRPAIGYKLAPNANAGYWSTEAGVGYRVNNNLSASYGFRVLSGMAVAHPITHTNRYAVTYAFDKVNSVTVRHDRFRYDAGSNNTGVYYNRNF
jgi:hypothetical protein